MIGSCIRETVYNSRSRDAGRRMTKVFQAEQKECPVLTTVARMVIQINSKFPDRRRAVSGSLVLGSP